MNNAHAVMVVTTILPFAAAIALYQTQNDMTADNVVKRRSVSFLLAAVGWAFLFASSVVWKVGGLSSIPFVCFFLCVALMAAAEENEQEQEADIRRQGIEPKFV